MSDLTVKMWNDINGDPTTDELHFIGLVGEKNLGYNDFWVFNSVTLTNSYLSSCLSNEDASFPFISGVFYVLIEVEDHDGTPTSVTFSLNQCVTDQCPFNSYNYPLMLFFVP